MGIGGKRRRKSYSVAKQKFIDKVRLMKIGVPDPARNKRKESLNEEV